VESRREAALRIVVDRFISKYTRRVVRWHIPSIHRPRFCGVAATDLTDASPHHRPGGIIDEPFQRLMSKTEIEQDPTCELSAHYALEPGEHSGGGPNKLNAEDGLERGIISDYYGR
jgi:hypothetical protein